MRRHRYDPSPKPARKLAGHAGIGYHPKMRDACRHLLRQRAFPAGPKAERPTPPGQGQSTALPASALTILATSLVALFLFLAPAPALATEGARKEAGLIGAASSHQLASLPPDERQMAPGLLLPRPLGEGDVALYREIFEIQIHGDWARADRLIARLEDRLLLGHVLAQRYLHPTLYRTPYRELAAWLEAYADHPEAPRLHALALRRKPARAAAPQRPINPFTRSLRQAVDEAELMALEAVETASAGEARPEEGELDGAASPSPRALDRVRTPAEQQLRRRVSGMVLREHLTAAGQVIDEAERAGRLRPAAIDRTRTLVAAGWFRWGDTERALEMATRAAQRSRLAVPEAHFWAGLAAFHLERHDIARDHFETLAMMPGLNEEDRSRAAFWAARANLVGGHPEQVGPWLDRAAEARHSFYGLLARGIRGKALVEPAMAAGRDLPPNPVSDAAVETLLQAPPVRRALALIQIGEGERAERELRAVPQNGSAALLRAVMRIAEAGDMPASALRAARVLKASTGEVHDEGLFPAMPWVPEGGYQIDRALIFALARQESAFNPWAVSHRGARGLLQLIPATANYMAEGGQPFRGANSQKLHAPELNLALGQKYIAYLLEHPLVDGNLVLKIASYNGGPGNVARWLREIRPREDPLIFIESIPLFETRHFVKTILANLWIYRARMDQDVPSLHALAGGEWPRYVSLDQRLATPYQGETDTQTARGDP